MNIFKILQEKAKNLTILCVDDEDALRKSIVVFLKKFFKSVDDAQNGVEALKKYKDNSYDIVLTDIEMPKMNGLELSKEIKKTDPNTQVIVLSAFDNKEYLLKSIEIGINHYLTKPLNNDEIVVTLLKCIDTIELKKEIENQRELILEQSRKSLMSDMLNNISHHWRQPLNSIGITIQKLPFLYDMNQLDKKTLDKSVASSMVIIQELSNSLDQFRSFFKPSQYEKFNPIEVLNEIFTLMNDSFIDGNIEFIFTIKDDSNIEIFGDVNEFKQAILNILTNAKEIVSNNKVDNPKVELMLVNNEDSIDIIIVDNGGGMEDDAINHALDPFFTTHNIAQKKGLGLYISNTIFSKKMDGALKVENYKNGLRVLITIKKVMKE